MNYEKLLNHYRADFDQTTGKLRGQVEAELRESINKGEFSPHKEMELGKAFAACFGWHNFYSCRSNRDISVIQTMEASGAVETAAFASISGQIVYSTTLESYKAPEFVFSKKIPTVSTVFDGEKVAGITGIGERFPVVGEGKDYPLFGVSEQWINTPSTKKRGGIVPVTREAIFFDRTGQLIEQCKDVGYWAGYDKELRAIDCVIDENEGAVSAMTGGHRYHYKNNSIATYGDSSGTHNWDNLSASTALVDWTDIESAELLFDAMTDPGTGVITGAYRMAANEIIVPTALMHTLQHILNAREIRLHAGGYATTGNLYDQVSPSSLQPYTILTSPLIAFRMATDTNWFMGNVEKAFRYMENWPIQTKEAPTTSHDEFHRDIVQQFRVDERGAYTTFDPRFMVKATA